MAQSGQWLPHKHEDLNLIPRTHTNNPGTVVYTVPSTGEVETRGSLWFTASQAYLVSSRPVTKTGEPDRAAHTVPRHVGGRDR